MRIQLKVYDFNTISIVFTYQTVYRDVSYHLRIDERLNETILNLYEG